MQKPARKSVYGFTLVELMMVVAILGIMSALALPYFNRNQVMSKRTESIIGLAAIFTGEQSYYSLQSVYSTPTCVNCECTTQPDPTQWSRNIAVAGTGLSGQAKFYGFCVELPTPITFIVKAAGNIDRDPTYDQVWVYHSSRDAVVFTDDFVTP